MQLSNFHGFFANFGTGIFFMQFSPVDPLENELYGENIKSSSSKNTILAVRSCLKVLDMAILLCAFDNFYS